MREERGRTALDARCSSPARRLWRRVPSASGGQLRGRSAARQRHRGSGGAARVRAGFEAGRRAASRPMQRTSRAARLTPLCSRRRVVRRSQAGYCLTGYASTTTTTTLWKRATRLLTEAACSALRPGRFPTRTRRLFMVKSCTQRPVPHLNFVTTARAHESCRAPCFLPRGCGPRAVSDMCLPILRLAPSTPAQSRPPGAQAITSPRRCQARAP